MKKLKIGLSFALVLILMMSCISAGALSAAPEVSAKSALLINLNTGTVLYEKNSLESVSPSSLTKVMTALLVLEKTQNLDDEITVSESAVSDVSGMTTASLKVGEVMSLRDLLSCALVRSAGDACNVLAEYVSGSIPSFVETMNAKAEALGMKDTTFRNAHGRDEDGQVTTTADLRLLAEYAMQNARFMELCNVQYKYIPETNMSAKRYYYSSNSMIISNASQRNEAYYYRYANGMMAAYSEKAGYCLMTTAQKDGIELLAIVMGSTRTEDKQVQSYVDVKSLFSWCFDNFQLVPLLKKGAPVSQVDLKLCAQNDQLILTADKSFQALIPKEASVDTLERKFDLPAFVRAPIEKGAEIGTLTFLYDGVAYGTAPLVSASSADRSFFLFVLDAVGSFLKSTVFRIILAVIILLVILYVVLFIRGNRRRRSRKRRYRR